MPPYNKIATDEQILKAIKEYETHAQAAQCLGIATKTLKNRLTLIRQRQPEEPRPNTYEHKKVKRYFISSVVSDAPLDMKLYKSIRTMCNDLDAQEIYIPVSYDWQIEKQGKRNPTYPRSIKHLLLSEDIHLNKHLNLMGSVPLHATLQNPLTGLKHVSHNKSAIFAHPQRAMESVATPKSELPKLLYTTGAITEPRYTRSKQGRKAQDYHTMGGLIVEVSNSRFHIFEVTGGKDGSIYHLDKKYSGDNVEATTVSGIYMADEHAEFYPKDVKKCTYTAKDSLVKVLKPEYVCRGDVYNHGSDSHHGRNNILERIVRADNGGWSVQAELDQCYDHIKQTTVGDYKNIIVSSNHHDHLKRWLNEFNPHTGDPRNIYIYHHLNAMMIENALVLGRTSVDPFELYGRANHKELWRECIFLGRDDDYTIAGVSVDLHGDVGANGARGSATNLSLGGQPLVIGHGHSPKVYRNVHQVGVSAMEMGYNKGYSGWMATHCVIYPDGNKTLVHLVEGKWRL